MKQKSNSKLENCAVISGDLHEGSYLKADAKPLHRLPFEIINEAKEALRKSLVEQLQRTFQTEGGMHSTSMPVKEILSVVDWNIAHLEEDLAVLKVYKANLEILVAQDQKRQCVTSRIKAGGRRRAGDYW